MAFFRCGGSGIPASLKSGMNSVLNKKFGTSTTYDPAGWPADVNLLGPLPIKTASGAIAHIEDGADGVPVKSCVVSFLPSGGGGTPSAPVAIVGHSGITLTNKDNMSTPTHTDTYTDTFGQTIYGGSRDLTTDKASVTWGYHKVNASETGSDYLAGTNNNGNRIGFTLPDAESPKYSGCLSNCFENRACLNSATWTVGSFCIYGTKIYIVCPNEYNTYQKCLDYLLSINAEFAYPLATPTEITGLTPHEIDTLYGDNNIYSDTGTTTVEYRADIDLALNA